MGRDARRRRAARDTRKKASMLHELTLETVTLQRGLEGGHDGLAGKLDELEKLRALVPGLLSEQGAIKASLETFRELQLSLEEDLETSERELGTQSDELDVGRRECERLSGENAEIQAEIVKVQAISRQWRDFAESLADDSESWRKLISIAAITGDLEVDKDGNVVVMVGSRSRSVSLDEAARIVGLED